MTANGESFADSLRLVERNFLMRMAESIRFATGKGSSSCVDKFLYLADLYRKFFYFDDDGALVATRVDDCGYLVGPSFIEADILWLFLDENFSCISFLPIDLSASSWPRVGKATNHAR